MGSKIQQAKVIPNAALVVARTNDHPGRVLAAVRYAELGNQRVVLAQVASTPVRRTGEGARRRAMGGRSRRDEAGAGSSDWPSVWSEILSRVFLLGNIHLDDIPEIGRAMRVHHLLLSCPQLAEQYWDAGHRYETSSIFDAPVWVMGRNASSSVPERINRILLPLSLRTGFAGRLRVATQLAKRSGATLAVLHVVPRYDARSRHSCTPWTVNSRLQQFFDRLSDTPCPLEISLRDGDPAEAILNFDRQNPHDVVILRGSEVPAASQPFCATTRRILNEVRCPVLLARPEAAETQNCSGLRGCEVRPEEMSIAGGSRVVQ